MVIHPYLPGKSHGQNLAGSSLWGHKQSDMNEHVDFICKGKIVI